MLILFFRLAVLMLSNNTKELAQATSSVSEHYLTEQEARTHVIAAQLASTPEVSTELLLGMAFVESRYDAQATSRVHAGRRETGVPPWAMPPKNVSGPYFCGVTQSEAGYSWNKCLDLRNVFVGYGTTAVELERWFRVCALRYPRMDRLDCALTGYGGGFPAIKAGTSTYPRRVRYRALRIKKARAFITT